jgi:hypothetical protein
MNYSTLQEAYNIDTFEKKPKPSNKSRNPNGSGSGANGSSANAANANTSPAFVETSKLALSSCSPLQAPTYNIPISNDCKREHEEAMNVYTNANNNNNTNTIPTSINNTQHFSNGTGNSISASNTGSPNIISNPNNANNLQLTQSLSSQASLLPAQNLFSNSNDNVMPYYDEDLEQYFNISNLNDEVKYNPNNPNNSSSNSSSNSNNASNSSSTKYPYMPNNNRHSYTNNDTAEYTNNNTLIKNGNNLLNNSSYNLTPEEKKSAEEAMAYLKSIEDKINGGGSGVASGYNRNTIADPVAPTVNTGPAGFKTPEKPVAIPAAPQPIVPVAKNESNYIYNAIFNISILLIIGIAIILLCDQIVELSIHIGMKRTINILEPFIKAHAAAQAAQAAALQAAAQAAQAQTIA